MGDNKWEITTKVEDREFEIFVKEFGSEVYSVQSHPDLEISTTTTMEYGTISNSVVEETPKKVEDDNFKLQNPRFGPCTEFNHVHKNPIRVQGDDNRSINGEKSEDAEKEEAVRKEKLGDSNNDDKEYEKLNKIVATKEICFKEEVFFNESDDEEIIARITGQKTERQKGALLRPRRPKLRRPPCLEGITLTTRTLREEKVAFWEELCQAKE
ncbi:hypothetical protein PIB30_066499 [Stylosanthes scabra]|uniref:Uncharacterized protein n=1 Tax=Stylosanthes scabra TaxID=79078 RepID=A0ABU6UPI3_9FABA|nr:hypothetical protein [Stylosanthes scabra]